MNLKLLDLKYIAHPATACLIVGLLLASPGAKADTSLSTKDNDFLLAAAQGGMTEVKLGELATTNAKRDDVKEFGQMMVKDHSAINNDLKALAAQKNVTLPDTLDATHQGMVDKLAALNGTEFDDAYIAAMIKAHKKDAKAFKAVAAETEDIDVKNFLNKSIPIVDQHLDHITAMKK
jgi:putative membrane protein